MRYRIGAIAIILMLLSLTMPGCAREEMGCEHANPPCGEAFDCIKNRCIPKKGCEWGYPPCDADHQCIGNACVLREGCDFDNPSCSEHEYCTENHCYLKEGCEHGNPPCPEGHACQDGSCIEVLRDQYGRLTSYALSEYGGVEAPDLSSLEKLHPELYGTDHGDFGGHSMRLGDGFVVDDLLVKVTQFHPKNATSVGYIVFEVFRKEADGQYYHYPTRAYKVSRLEPARLLGIVIESPSYSYEIGSYENPLVFYPDCGSYNEGCSGPGCQIDCGEEFAPGIVSYPEGYGELADFVSRSLDSTYPKTASFLGFDPGKDVSVSVRLAERTGPILADDGLIALDASPESLDSAMSGLDKYEARLSSNGCSSYMRLGHELVHCMTSEMLDSNVLVFEGIAEFAEFHDNCTDAIYICEDHGWRYPHEDSTRPYSDMSASPGTGILPSHYATGFCFWQDYLDLYGYVSFRALMQDMWQKGRGAEPYCLSDLMADAAGKPLPQDMLERYSLPQSFGCQDICRGCQAVFSEG